MALQKPEIDFPDGNPPADLQIIDEVVGDGPEAKPGHNVKVHYVGVSFSTGEEFDASWNRGQAFEFPLGAGRVIGGWDQGVAGMKVGGRRRLVIPPHLGYGTRGAPPRIKPNETLIFVVDLLGVS
ncbi:FKBP-type peptidyl-prolyl cis-trans isomerase [Nonomuraea sp. NN258]|uniref:FKBP-type peptidyl-prolyl cis-trans isomerase n=1 Tax=Nonomuraea antri TaxID=2730852 RepID=UPI001568C70C|nr:FKBP-type peptidyl-prolyl cis-trans isomerase [Nonomuraea antri]NRQ38700.1 FKBP-type peptidyl-prolyl cis-trans isomerase [Nonomuraea antri]